jgi:hypothetical protein
LKGELALPVITHGSVRLKAGELSFGIAFFIDRGRPITAFFSPHCAERK